MNSSTSHYPTSKTSLPCLLYQLLYCRRAVSNSPVFSRVNAKLTVAGTWKNRATRMESTRRPVRFFDPHAGSSLTVQHPSLPFDPQPQNSHGVGSIRLQLQSPPDTILDFLEENHSLEDVTLGISFAEAFLRHSQRKTPIGSKLRHLSIYCYDAMDDRALISSIALRKGVNLEICFSDHYSDESEGLTDILSGISLTHLLSFLSPVFMEHRSCPRMI